MRSGTLHQELRSRAKEGADVTTIRARHRGRAWRGRIFLGSGQMLYAGPVAPTTMHAHHAFQLVISLSEPIALRAQDRSATEAVAALIPPDEAHVIESAARAVLMLYVDPQALHARALRRDRPNRPSAACERWTEAGRRLAAAMPSSLPSSGAEARALIGAMLDVVGAPEAPRRVLHPGVRSVFRVLPALLEPGAPRPSLVALARYARISPSRLAHIFRENVGIPLRPYVLWLRLQQAGAALAAGESVTSAALAAGFADAAHLTRVFRRMFGLAPSEIARSVEWIILPPASEQGREAATK